MIATSRGEGSTGDWLLTSTGLLFGVMKVFRNEMVVVEARLSEYTRPRAVLPKGLSFMVCELFLNKAVIKKHEVWQRGRGLD